VRWDAIASDGSSPNRRWPSSLGEGGKEFKLIPPNTLTHVAQLLLAGDVQAQTATAGPGTRGIVVSLPSGERVVWGDQGEDQHWACTLVRKDGSTNGAISDLSHDADVEEVAKMIATYPYEDLM
jgi:hypothetical protein